MVGKILPSKNGFKKNIVYTEVIHGANYITEQAPRLKKLIQLFNLLSVVIFDSLFDSFFCQNRAMDFLWWQAF